MESPNTAKTQRELAAIFGITQPAILKMLHRDGCPIKSKGPWSAEDIDALSQWRAGMRSDRSSPDYKAGDDLGIGGGDVSTKLKVEQTLMLQARRAVLERDWVPRSKVETGMTERALYFRTSLENLPGDICGLLENRPSDEVERLLRERLNGIIDSYTRRPYPGME